MTSLITTLDPMRLRQLFLIFLDVGYDIMNQLYFLINDIMTI